MAKSIKTWVMPLVGLSIMSISTHAATQFPTTYTDQSNGLSWSKELPGTYSNGCVNAKGEPDDSDSNCALETNPDRTLKIVGGHYQVRKSDSLAAQACDKIGGRLPTAEEIESLFKNFEQTKSGNWMVLTEKGKDDVHAAFGDNEDTYRPDDNLYRPFWSSSVGITHDEAFHSTLWNGSPYPYPLHRSAKFAVHCVSGR